MSYAYLIAVCPSEGEARVELYYHRDFNCWHTKATYPSGAIATVSVPSYRARELFLAADEAGTAVAEWPVES